MPFVSYAESLNNNIQSVGLYYYSSTSAVGNPSGNYLGGQTGSNGSLSGSLMLAYGNSSDFYVGVYMQCSMNEPLPRGTTFDVSTTFGYSLNDESSNSYNILPYEVSAIGYSSIWNQTLASKSLSRSGASTATSNRYYGYGFTTVGPVSYLRLYIKFKIPANTDTSGDTGSAYLSIANLGINLDSVVINYSNELSQISGKIDLLDSQLSDINNSIQSGFDSVLNPDQGDVDSVNGFKDQINDNKQEASDIKDQLNSVDKPDSGQLNDQVDIDQYIDKYDEGVIEFGSILSSVFDIDIITKYMLILLSLGLVSLVFFGKKGS